MKRRATQLGELQCQVLDAVPDGKKPELGVVLCHGFGAPANDLVSLAPALADLHPELATRVRFVFPGAPLSLAEYGAPYARAWWHLPPEVLTGRSRDWSRYVEEVPEGLPPSRRALMSAIEAFSRGSELPYQRIVLGGFSQGAMLATDVALRLEEAPAGLVVLSGSLLTRPEWAKRAAPRKGLPVLQSHGREDDVLPFAFAEQLRDLLVKAELAVDFLPFDGPHTIPPEALARLGAFLIKRLEPKR